MSLGTVVNNATNASAVAAVASPWWLPLLKSTSEYAAFILPIMGVIWLAIQMVGYLIRVWKHGVK